ncbi:hypothetical protein F4818DRAFT_408849 [Hypoxylon cercidicola]|nr:hypothetical protein F4818DRAFT_408849 [Hypoxylon cercidicola]
MYRNTYTSSSGGDQHNYTHKGHAEFSSSQRGPPGVPPPPSQPQPPQPPQWNGHQSDYRDVYQFRGPYSALRQGHSDDRHRDNGDHRDRDNYRPPQGDFTFRVDRPSGIDSYRPSEREQQASRDYGDERNASHRRRSKYAPVRDGPRRNEERRQIQEERQERRPRRDRAQPQRRAKKKDKTSDRPLLVKNYDDHPELMLGDTTARVTYRDADELSDSDETEMDISEGSDSEVAEPATKRARTSATVPTNAEQEVPRWSNPDPYTALPPPDESTRKKKNMVHLIRKARVGAEAKNPAVPIEGLDFISCDFSDDDNAKGGAKQKSRMLPNGAAAETSARQATSNKVPTSLSGASTLPPKPPVSTNQQRTENTDHLGSNSAASGTKNNPVDLTASTSFGSRKRTFDDAIKLPHTSLKPASKMRADGGVVWLWKASDDENPCPWAVVDHSATLSVATRLHKEIMDFYEWVRPRSFEQHVREMMVKNLAKLIKKKWPDASVFPFGSYMSGLYLPTGDMDIAICSDSFTRYKVPKYGKKNHLYALRSHLTYYNAAYRGEVEVIANAKVPLIKYTDNETGLKVDISFEKLDGANAVGTFLEWKEKYPVMPILVAVIKQFLLMRGLNEPVNGGIGGFSIICLVVNLLNQMPQVQSYSMNPELHLGELLMEFFDYYGNHFQYETVAIRMNPPGLVPKNDVSSVGYRNFDRLSILDPNNPENDIAGGSRNTPTILESFSRAHKTLRDRMAKLAQGVLDDSDQTILAPLFAGSYSCFVDQRNYLERLAAQGLPEYVSPKYSMW